MTTPYNSTTLTFNREKWCVIVLSPLRVTAIDNELVLVGVTTLEPLAIVVGIGLFNGMLIIRSEYTPIANVGVVVKPTIACS